VHASWLNQAEIYFSIVQRKALQPNNFPDLDTLEQHLLACGRRYEQIARRLLARKESAPALRVRPTELDLIAERLTAGGSTVHWDNAIPDTRRFYTADPWGNRIELVGAS